MNATVYPIPSREERYHTALGGSPETWAAIAEIQRAQDARNAAVLADAEQVKRWRAEDRANGIEWSAR